jgi:uncharacterized membrane protein YeaQ/YmgE (transglycosylase-associated protein family)
LGIGLLCFLTSVYTATKLLSVPVRAWQPIDVAEAIFGFFCFFFLSWIGVSGRYAIAPRPAGPVPRPNLPSFFIPAVVTGLAVGAAVAYWEAKTMGWSVTAAAEFAIVIALISGGMILVTLRLFRR